MTVAEMSIVVWCFSVGLADLHARRIPNGLTLGGGVLAIGWLLISGHSMLNASVQSVGLGVLASLLLTLPAYYVRVLGAADVKLFLAMALMAGWYLSLLAFVIASMLALLFLGVSLLWARPTVSSGRQKRWIPYGAALSAGLVYAIGAMQ